MKATPPFEPRRPEFLDAVQKGLLLGAAALVVFLPPAGPRLSVEPAVAVSAPAVAGVAPAALPSPPASRREAPSAADFGQAAPAEDVRRVANWAVSSRDYQKMSFIIVDKKAAQVYVFDPLGRLKAWAPALLGSAIGDDSVPGIGTKPIRLVRPEERTTPAGRFVAEPGMSSSRKEDVVWVDYESAVSMHRVINLVASERRLERIVSPDPADHRISYGCINLPRAFYENVVSPAVRHGGAVIYVLPETRPVEQVFGSMTRQPLPNPRSVG